MRSLNGEGMTNGREEPNGGGLTDGPGMINGLAYTGGRVQDLGGLMALADDGPEGMTVRRDLINGFSIEGKAEWKPRRKRVKTRMEELAEGPMPGEPGP